MLKLTTTNIHTSSIEEITKDILYVWKSKCKCSFNIEDIKYFSLENIEYIKNRYTHILEYLEYGHLLEWLNKGKETFYALIILFILFSRCIYYNSRNMYKNDEKIVLFMEMGLDFYNITFEYESLYNTNLSKSSEYILQKYIMLLPFQILENILYQIQGKKIMYKYLIKENNIEYKKKLRKILHYQKKRIYLLETFNRFPVRNRLLNREPTINEIDYLDEQNSLNLK